MRDFGDDAFAGTAQYYAKYRPPYPKQIFDNIVRKFKLNGMGRLLGLGCGAGEPTIPLARCFEKALVLDPAPEMLNEAQKKVSRAGIKNIEWQKGTFKTLTEVKGPFRLIAMGQSFHWMDQEDTLDKAYALIEPSGGLVIVGSEPIAQNPLGNLKNEAIKELINKYLGPERRAGSKLYIHPDKRYEELLPNSLFRNFEEHFYEIELARTIDQIIGHLFSMSWASKKLLGAQAFDFENELRKKLEAISDNQKFIERFRFSTYMFIKS